MRAEWSLVVGGETRLDGRRSEGPRQLTAWQTQSFSSCSIWCYSTTQNHPRTHHQRPKRGGATRPNQWPRIPRSHHRRRESRRRALGRVYSTVALRPGLPYAPASSRNRITITAAAAAAIIIIIIASIAQGAGRRTLSSSTLPRITGLANRQSRRSRCCHGYLAPGIRGDRGIPTSDRGPTNCTRNRWQCQCLYHIYMLHTRDGLSVRGERGRRH